MSEAKRKQELADREIAQVIGVETLGGRIEVKWDSRSAATPFGQMAFFIEFLMLSGLYACWQDACPLSYQGSYHSTDHAGQQHLAITSMHEGRIGRRC